MEPHKGIEPFYSAWKADALATMLMRHLIWYSGGESNPYALGTLVKLVLPKGLEPSRREAQRSKRCVSAIPPQERN